MKPLFNRIVVITFLIIVINGITQSIISLAISAQVVFYFEVIACVVLICGCQYLSNRFKSKYYILELLAEYLMVCAIVTICAQVFAWFPFGEIWRTFVYVTPVYIATYFLGIARTKKEVDDINKLIRQRNERKLKNNE